MKKPWLFRVYRGWNPAQLYGDYFINHEITIPLLNNQYFMVTPDPGPRVFLTVAHVMLHESFQPPISKPTNATSSRPSWPGPDQKAAKFRMYLMEGNPNKTQVWEETRIDNWIGRLEALALFLGVSRFRKWRSNDWLFTHALSVGFWPLAFIQLKAVAKTDVELT